MWLPTPIYEALPYLYVVIGLLFIAGATYIGISTEAAPAYLGCGAISVLTGVFVYVRRAEARGKIQKSDSSEPPAGE